MNTVDEKQNSDNKKQAYGLASFFRRALFIVKILLVLVILIIVYANLHISRNAEGHLYTNLEDVPSYRVGLVLGTSWALRSGEPNSFFTYRIHAAAALFRAGKIEYVLVSGDNQYASYNEPRKMQQKLVDLGVPAERIVMDFAGFSTLDSVYRASRVFQLASVLVISQQFQNERAVFLGQAAGMEIDAFSARSVRGLSAAVVNLREIFARAKAFIDVYITHREPRFLGEPYTIPPESENDGREVYSDLDM